MDRYIQKVTAIASHRNGVAGESFNVVLFTSREGHDNMVAIVFPEPRHVAVFDRDMLGHGEIRMCVNSWRGDDFEPELRAAIAEHDSEEVTTNG
jgi:hypothetical protein